MKPLQDDKLWRKCVSTARSYVKGRPRLRNSLIRLRSLWHRLQLMFLVLWRKQDRLPAEQAMPALKHFRRGSCTVVDEMRVAYKDYTRSVSNESMPISLESACFLWSLCEIARPKRILDLGSGFSSFVFRWYSAAADGRTEVWSVDESAQWLEKTREFLISRGLSEDHLFTWDQFQDREPGSFDVISHDLGIMTERPDIFERILLLKTQNGMIIVDDLHMAHYRAEIYQRLQRYDYLSAYPLRWLTLDKYLRYSLLVR